MNKKMFNMFFTIIMLFGTLCILTGCGQKNSSETDGNSNNKQNEEIKPFLGTFAKSGEDVYFWKLDSESREASGLFSNYANKVTHSNTLMKIEKDGKQTEVIKESSIGKICVSSDKIFYEILSDENNYEVYCMDYNGENKKKCVSGQMKFVVGDYIYVQNISDIDVIDTKTCENTTVAKNGNLIGKAEESIFYIFLDSNNKGIKIGYISENKDNGEVASFNTTEYKEFANDDNANVGFINFNYINGRVKVNVGNIQGTGYFVQEGWTIEMDANGQNVTKKQAESSDKDFPESILGINDIIVNYNETDLIYKNTNTGVSTTILDEAQLKSQFNFEKDKEKSISVYSADLIDNDLYIVLDYGEHFSEEDIGWRYSYKRIKTVAFKYNLETKQVEKIYEF